MAGRDGISGYRDGNLAKALFNNPISLAIKNLGLKGENSEIDHYEPYYLTISGNK